MTNYSLGGNRRVRIGVVAPSRPISPDIREKTLDLCRSIYGDRAPDIWFHPQCFLSCGHFAGTDSERAQAFLDVANDDRFDALWFGRGGYGSFRLVESVLPALQAAARNKVYMGYSDAGAMLGALYAAGIGRVAHGPMPADVNRPGGGGAIGRALAFLVDGDASAVEPACLAATPTAAFNITILAHLIGTRFLPDLSGHLLMLEEVSEPLYRIDRALGQITSAPEIRGARGLMLGRCSDIVANDPEFGHGEEDIMRYWSQRSGIPYLGRADIGHDADNRVVPFGSWWRAAPT